jgi:hypothetical protein
MVAITLRVNKPSQRSLLVSNKNARKLLNGLSVDVTCTRLISDPEAE